MTITVEVNSLRMRACHGVAPQERIVGNEFELTIHVRCRISEQTMAADNIEGTINYAELVAVAKQVMAEPSALIENVVWRLRNSLRDTFPQIVGGHIRVAKLTPPIPSSRMSSAAVSLDW